MTPIDARRLGLIFGVVGLAAMIAGVITAYALSRAFEDAADKAPATPTPTPIARYMQRSTTESVLLSHSERPGEAAAVVRLASSGEAQPS